MRRVVLRGMDAVKSRGATAEHTGPPHHRETPNAPPSRPPNTQHLTRDTVFAFGRGAQRACHIARL